MGMGIQNKSMHMLSKQDLERILNNESDVVFSADGKTIYLRLYNSRTKNNYQCIKFADNTHEEIVCSCYQDSENVTRCNSSTIRRCIVYPALTEYLEKRLAKLVLAHEPLTEHPNAAGITQ